jgi:hypothetical protein
MRHFALSLLKSLGIPYRLYLLPVSLRPIFTPSLRPILYLSIVIEIDFEVNFFKFMMTLCLPHRSTMFFIAVTAAITAWEHFLLLGLVDLDDNRSNSLGFVELVNLHLDMSGGPRGLSLVNYDT